MKKNLKYLVALAFASAAGASQAAVDISAEVTAAKADIATAGALVLGVVVAAAVFNWIRRVI